LEKIIWKDEFSVGNKALDDQHKIIVKNINELSEHSEKSTYTECITRILNEIYKYVHIHLEYEELLLEKLDYPEVEEHKKCHLEYHETVAEILVKASSHDESSITEMLNFLIHWWKNHILIEDMAYKPFLESKKSLIQEITESTYSYR